MEQVSAIIQCKTPIKYKDLGCPTISVNIGDMYVEKALLDLGASVNLLPYSVYKQLGLRELKPTSITLSLVDSSIKIPRGVIEDVLVQTDKFYYPIDFIILDTEPIASGPNHLTFGNMTLKLNIFHLCKRHPNQDEDEQEVCLIDTLIEEHVEGIMNEELENSYKEFEENELEEKIEEANEIASINHSMEWKAKEKPLPLTNDEEAKKKESPKFNLKPLPNDLKYAYLEEDKYSVLISSKLSYQQETTLMEVRRKCKEAIGWSISDHKWTSHLIEIALEDQEKKIFTCPFGTYAYRRMPFGLCNAPTTFQRCMISIFSDMVERIMEVFMDELTIYVICDASDQEMEAILGQRDEEKPYVIYYASKTLNEAQKNYTTTEKELLAVVFTLDKFRAYLVGAPIMIFTDHSALKYLVNKKDFKARLIRWILLLQEFNLEIRDKKEFPDGALLKVDTNPWYAHIANYLVTGELPKEWTTQEKRFFLSKVHAYYWEEPFLYKYCADQIIRKCVPEEEKQGILMQCNAYACGSHFSTQKTALKLLQSVEAIACKHNDHKVVVKFLKENIFTMFGVLKAIISDGGTHFYNKTFNNLLARYGVKHKVARPYHPQTSGQVELANLEIKNILMKVVNANCKDWALRLHDAL
ncbi:hypothetical protein AAG906_001070 [Vitis piasezkii]